MTSERLVIGLHAAGPAKAGWRRILEQEGLPYEEATESVSGIGLFSGGLPPWFEAWVAEGGIAIISGAPDIPGLLGASTFAHIRRFLPPNSDTTAWAPSLTRLFQRDGQGEIRLHEDRKIKGGNDPDVFPLVCQKTLGAGSIIFSGVPIAKLLASSGDSLRRFSPFTEVDERVASVDKSYLTETLVWMIRKGFRSWNVPYFRLARFPEGAPSVFILRIDVDGFFGNKAQRLVEQAKTHNIPCSFFINGELCEQHPGTFTVGGENVELGQHGYFHNVYDDFDENLKNLNRGADWFRNQFGISDSGFVAPRGLWNQALDEALSETGYKYSSDFSLDFDSLPFRTKAGILQVPVHPYSPERAAAYAKDHGLPAPTPEIVTNHYHAFISRQVHRNLPAHIYGHPEVLGRMADQVLPSLLEHVSEAKIPALSLGQYASWWQQRESIRIKAEFNRDDRILTITSSSDAIPVDVFPTEQIVVKNKYEALQKLPD